MKFRSLNFINVPSIAKIILEKLPSSPNPFLKIHILLNWEIYFSHAQQYKIFQLFRVLYEKRYNVKLRKIQEVFCWLMRELYKIGNLIVAVNNWC